jgi:hypothetical protein
MGRSRTYNNDKDRKRTYEEIHKEERHRKNRERMQQVRMNMNEKEKIAARQKNREQVAKHRQQKVRVPTMLLPGLQESGFKCKQSLEKAIKRVDGALPKSPRKREEVLYHLCERHCIFEANGKSAKVWNVLTRETIERVTNFYVREEISWTSPNMKDIAKLPGTSERVSRLYMTVTLNEAYEIFKKENPEVKLSYSKFAKLRPWKVKLCGKIPAIMSEFSKSPSNIIFLSNTYYMHKMTTIKSEP